MIAHADHTLLVYDADDDFAGPAAAFLRDGLEAEEPVIAVYAPHRLALLREALGPDADDVELIEADGFYTRPEAALASYDATLRRHARDGAAAVRVTGELPSHAPRTPERWVVYDAILNRAFAGRPVKILCGYDTRTVPEPLVEAAWRCHPETLDGAPNPRFEDPAGVVRGVTPGVEPLDGLSELPLNGDSGAFRAELARRLAAAGVGRQAAADLLLATSEVLHNATRHGGGATAVRAGVVDGGFLCEVRDGGPGFDDPLAGYLPPPEGGDSGGGLWVARQLTGRLDIGASDGGMTVRLWT
jgi:anti-sigma regulatory factor (Ser/Thr protein kinase)